jgi:type IV secretory pathway TrbF-like protein
MNSNPYVEARREWDERYADLVLGKRNWQITVGGLVLVSLILAAGVVWQSTRSRFICGARALASAASLTPILNAFFPRPN